MQLILRAAVRADGDAIRDVVFAVMREYGLRPDPDGVDRDLDDVEQTYQSNGGMFAVVEDTAATPGRVIGTVALLKLRDDTAELRKMYLAKPARGRGLGKRMLRYALTEARRLGFARVELDTNSALVEAIGLYCSFGFTPMELVGDDCRCEQRFGLDLAPDHD